MDNINNLRKELDLRDKRKQASVPSDQRSYKSIASRRERLNRAVRAFKKYDSNMQSYAVKKKGVYSKHLQVPQSEYMGTAAKGNSNG